MARGLDNYPNRTAHTTAFPHGQIADNDGTGNGTPVNQFTNDDIHQFLDKLLRLASITPNGLPENETGGFQYITALKALIASQVTWTNIPLLNGWAAVSGATPQYRVSSIGKIELRGQLDASSATSDLVTATSILPVSTYNIQLTASRIRVSTFAQEAKVVSINTNGRLSADDHANSITVFLDGLSYWIN